jgi:GR25 family glycosyltransferase involved in LPS biosynthesis
MDPNEPYISIVNESTIILTIQNNECIDLYKELNKIFHLEFAYNEHKYNWSSYVIKIIKKIEPTQIYINKDKLKSIEPKKIAVESKQITFELSKNPVYQLFIINLKRRPDRKNNIIEQFKNMKNIHSSIQLIFFEAYNEKCGRIGCAKSHIALINYAKQNNMKYIIVVEDDFLFNPRITVDKFYEILETLTTNTNQYKIFNGSPTFWDKRNSLQLIHKYNSMLPQYYFIEFGQTTTFMVYTSECYEDIIKYYDPVISELHIDQYLSHTFVQLCYDMYICYQRAGYSDITNTETDHDEFITSAETFYKNIYILPNRTI